MRSTRHKILFAFGTRPEAIKLAPVILAMRKHGGLRPIVCVTGQHRSMLDQALATFGIKPHYDLEVMKEEQSLFDVTIGVLSAMEGVLEKARPDMVVVQGDTTTTMAASLGAYYMRVPVAHVEAGLRTADIRNPYPEELNRQVAGRIAELHLAPTVGALENLLAEGIDESSAFVTGNTAVDALFLVKEKIEAGKARQKRLEGRFPFLRSNRRLLLVTAHRRESFGEGMESIFGALKDIADRHPYVDVVYPVHLNPRVKMPASRALGLLGNVHLVEPVSYEELIFLMMRSYFILTDSGGIQEEAPSLGRPVLVMRDVTERPEALDSGVARLVGTSKKAIVNAAEELLSDKRNYKRMVGENPFGDGKASGRIIKVIFEYLEGLKA